MQYYEVLIVDITQFFFFLDITKFNKQDSHSYEL